MIKKLVSNALLSMVMDKKAREKFTAAQDEKRRARDGDAPKAPAQDDKAQPSRAPSPTMSNAAAPAKTVAPRPPSAGEEDDAEALIREALESAELELINKRKRKSMTPERQALIEQAMAIQRSKSHVLDELDPNDRDKLTFMAMKALDPDFGE